MKERRKWIHFFDNVNGIIFAASLTSYDEINVFWYNEHKIGIHESLQVFNQQINNPLWSHDDYHIPIFLFLTKCDLFVDKIKRSPITIAFPEYKGKQDAQECYQYIKQQFKNQSKDKNRRIYVRCVSTMNRDCVERVMNEVQHIVTTYSPGKIFYGLEWKRIRLIWIAFLKNDDNDKCLIKLLPKDVLKCIVNLLPHDESWQWW